MIVGLVILSAGAMTAAGFAMQNAADAIRQHAFTRTQLTAGVGPADPVTNRRQAVTARHVFLTDQRDSVMAALLQQRSGILLAITSGVRGVAFSPAGQLLASAYGNGTVALWNLATHHLYGPLLRVRSGSQADVDAVAFSPDGQLLASADANGIIQLWTPATGQAAFLDAGRWLVIVACVIAIALSGSAVAITALDIDWPMVILQRARHRPRKPDGTGVGSAPMMKEGRPLPASLVISVWRAARRLSSLGRGASLR